MENYPGTLGRKSFALLSKVNTRTGLIIQDVMDAFVYFSSSIDELLIIHKAELLIINILLCRRTATSSDI